MNPSLVRRLVVLSCLSPFAGLTLRAAPLPRSAPEAQGISSAAIEEFVTTAGREIDGMHGFMLVRHGQVVAEGWWSPYGAERPHTFYSLTKSFTSTAVGLAIAEGRLSLHDRVIDFFPEEAPAEPSEELQAMRVRDLLSMSTGHHAEDLESLPMGAVEGVRRAFLTLPVAHKPGTHFLYNTPGSHMLSEIVQRVTGERLSDYLRPRLFEPLGVPAPAWAETPEGVSLGGYGMAAPTETIAKFGLLYLRQGRWQDRQLIPADWVALATSRQTSNGSNPDSDWDQGYGFQFWQSRHGYRGDGAFGQFCLILPKYDVVVAINSGVRDMQAVMNLVWTLLLPAMEDEALPENPAAHERLAAVLDGLEVAVPAGAATSPRASAVSGTRYTFSSGAAGIDGLRWEFGHDGALLIVTKEGDEHRIPVGYGAWRESRTGLLPELHHEGLTAADQPVAAAGAWTDEQTFRAQLLLVETPYALTIDTRFEDGSVTVEMKQNVAFGPREYPTLHGRPAR